MIVVPFAITKKRRKLITSVQTAAIMYRGWISATRIAPMMANSEDRAPRPLDHLLARVRDGEPRQCDCPGNRDHLAHPDVAGQRVEGASERRTGVLDHGASPLILRETGAARAPESGDREP